MPQTERTELALLALADAVLIAGDAFAPPHHRRLADRAADRATLQRLGHLLDRESRIDVVNAMQRCFELAASTEEDAWHVEHTRLFEGAVACPINETAYVRRDKGAIIADLCGFYRAFGFEPDETCGEKPDHLRCELEFIALLLVLLVNAVKEGDDDAAEVTRNALQSFLRDHLGEWIRLFHDRLVLATRLAVCAHGAELLRAVWTILAARFAVPDFDALESVALEPTADDADTPYECGMAEEEAERLVPLTGPPGSGLPAAE